MSGKISTCKSPDCQARIVWALNPATGRKVPLDAVPTPSDDRLVLKSTYHYVVDPGGETCHRATADEWNDHGVEVRVSHFRTCRDVQRWSTRKEQTTA